MVPMCKVMTWMLVVLDFPNPHGMQTYGRPTITSEVAPSMVENVTAAQEQAARQTCNFGGRRHLNLRDGLRVPGLLTFCAILHT